MTSIAQLASTSTASADLVSLTIDANALQALTGAIESGSDCACALMYVYDESDAG